MTTVAEVKTKTNKMRSNEYEAWRSHPANRAEVALLDGPGVSTPGFKRTDFNSQPRERTAVMRPCRACGRDVAVASDYQETVYCSEECIKLLGDEEQRARNVLQSFANSEPRFYPCQYNTQRLVDYFQANRDVKWNLGNIKQVFATLFAEGKMLPNVSLKDIRTMSGEQYAERARLDPELGGHREAIDKDQALVKESQRRPVESAQPGFELRPREAAMQAAATQDLRNKAAAYDNRGKVQMFVNGVPQEAPTTSQHRVFRNGRLVS
jgi:hypothetical protein